MKVNIEGNVFLESDGNQFIIKKYTGKVYTDKNGKETEAYDTLGYFNQLKHALGHLVRMKIMESTANTLQELIEEIKQIELFIESKVKY